MTTYTIINSNSGLVEDRGVSLETAARELLGYDGFEYEIRRADDGRGYELWVSRFSRNSTCYNGLTRSVVFSISDDEAAATAEIYQRVIESGHWTGPDVITDEQYDRMIAEMEDSE